MGKTGAIDRRSLSRSPKASAVASVALLSGSCWRELATFPCFLPVNQPTRSASLADLLAFVRSQARIEARDYLDPWSRGELHRQQVSAWRRDCRLRDQARRACFQAFPGRLNRGAEVLIPGSYGRLSIDSMGVIDYTIGQYAPREIYGALLSYLEATN